MAAMYGMQIYDYVIIGSGAGGCAAAYGLGASGKSVLLVEKGEMLPTDGSTLDVDKVVRQGLFKSKEQWLDHRGRVIVPEEHFNLGGKTKWYGAALLRFGPEEFAADPAHACRAWPFGYAELAPYYAQAEALLGVRRFGPEPELERLLRRVLRSGSAPDGDPRAEARSGWRSQPLPLGLEPEIAEHPHEIAHFDGFASVRGLKADAEQALLRRVRGRANVSLVAGNPVQDLLASIETPERVAGVVCADGTAFHARTVLLAAGALHSPRLLQRYLESNGLAARLPSYRMVGRNCKLHLLTALLGFSWRRNRDRLRKTVLLLNDRFPHSSVQPLGFDAQLIGELIPRFVPRAAAQALGERAYGFFLQTEDGSHESNRVIESLDGASPPRLDYDPARTPAAAIEHRRLVRAFQRALLGAGFVGAAQAIPVTGTAHACGTLVTGNDPERSVVDARGRVHGLANVYVVDGSVLPRSSRENPSLTIYAWALRIAHLLEPASAAYVRPETISSLQPEDVSHAH